MLCHFYFRKIFILSLLMGISLFLHRGIIFAATGTTETDDGTEVLTRGQIHEAFADVSVDEAAPVTVTSSRVPDPINEVPPDYRPEGENIEWIPGYWSWDEGQNDFIWISGVWRDIPPGRQWIPGYWMSVEGGNQYISGYWANIDQEATEYLPPPPKPINATPSSPPQTANHVWISGTWVWHGSHYVWQSGYWYEPRPDMIWTPAHYVWTPRGYIFVGGYWDYQFGRRGVMFAPVHFARPVYTHRHYYYSPRIVLDCDAVILSLFIHRGSHRYYFGDYYDSHYETRGFFPWFSRHATRFGYDPFYQHHRWRHLRHDHDWEHRYHRQFEYRRNHKEARPPHIFARQANHNSGQLHAHSPQMIGRRLKDVVDRKDQQQKFTRVREDRKKELLSRDRQLGEFQVERRKLEGKVLKGGVLKKQSDPKRSERLQMPKSPIKAQPARSAKSSVNSRAQARPQDLHRFGTKEQRENKTRSERQKRQVEQPETRQKIKSQDKTKGDKVDRSQARAQIQPQTEAVKGQVAGSQIQPVVRSQNEQQKKKLYRSQVQTQISSQQKFAQKTQERHEQQLRLKPQKKEKAISENRFGVQSQSRRQQDGGFLPRGRNE